MWTISHIAAAILLLGLIMYAAFGGADFGGGIWTALASGPRKKEQRESLFQAIGPVWETNHIWLIFVVVVLFMVFPRAFSALFIALLVPFIIALIGINFRGAAFAFRHFGEDMGRGVPLVARTFEISSILTPFAMGMAVTAVAQGHIGFEEGQVYFGPWDWITPFTFVGGLVGLAICAYLAPVYMTVRTQGALREDFRKRGMAAGWALGILTTLEIPVAIYDAPLFASRFLLGRTLTFIALAAAFGILTEILLWKRRYLGAQISAGGTIAATFAGFGAALYPDLLMGQLTIAHAAAPRETILAFFMVLPFGVAVLLPSLFFLYWTFRGPPDPDVPPDKFKA